MIVPQVLTVLMTNGCTARCSHCCMNSAPGREGKLSFQIIQKAVQEISEIEPPKTVVFAGGEPTLVKGDLMRAIQFCTEKGIVTRLVTNASWARTEKSAAKMVARLRRAGLAELNLSIDDYHTPYIPVESVFRAWRASKGQGFSAVVLANSHGAGSLITPEYIMEKLGEKIELRYDDDGSETPFSNSEDGTYYCISNSLLQKLERASDEVPETAFRKQPDQEQLNVVCPYAIRSAALSPTGNLLSCCGFELHGNDVLEFGSVETKPVRDLLATANDNIIVIAIAYLGPLFLNRFVRSIRPDLKIESRFGSICEACHSVVTNEDAKKVLSDHSGELAAAVMDAKEHMYPKSNAA